MIRLEDINKIYHGKDVETQALKNINLTIHQGEFVGIIGTSGSGKTTLLNILGAMAHPTSGRYFYKGTDVTALSKKKFHEFRKEHISFVFQNFELMDRYTVFENVEMPLIARGKKKNKEQVKKCLDMVGIGHLQKKIPIQLSGGEKQRCAIARALVTESELILADEPTGALDGKNTESILQIFQQIHEMGRTVIMITHDMEVAGQCKRLVRIEDGEISEG